MKSIISYQFLIGALIVGGLVSCEKKPTSESSGADSLMIEYKALTDSVAHNWETMIADDDEKHIFMKRLLLEVSYTNNYDKERFKELTEQVDRLKEMRYDQNTMADSELIDAYDSASWDLTDQIIEFARAHPRFDDVPLMSELINDISGKNNYVLMHRIHYDNWVKELNSFKAKNKEKLIHADPAADVATMPLFELPS